jgi:hypothetical protein
MQRHGPVLVAVKVIPDPEQPPLPDRAMAEGWAQVRRALADPD